MEDYRPSMSPPLSPGSPLTYLPQVQMEPMSRAAEASATTAPQEFHGVAGWPAQPKLVPVVIVCECAGRRMQGRGMPMHRRTGVHQPHHVQAFMQSCPRWPAPACGSLLAGGEHGYEDALHVLATCLGTNYAGR